jgi:hypothetical protein
MTRAAFDRIRSALITPCGREHKLYGEVGRTGGGYVLGRLHVPGDDDYVARTSGFVEIDQRWMVRTLMDYRDHGADGILEIHSHPFQGAAFFSAIDDAYIHGVREDFDRRNCGGAFLRMVVTPVVGEFALQAFDREAGRFHDVPLIEIVDQGGVEQIITPRTSTGVGASLPPSAACDRVAAVRTPEEHRRVARAHVVVVGAGGTGWLAAQWLACLGVGALTLVDGDVVEAVNVNRLVGVTREELERGAPKVECLARLLSAQDPDRPVSCIPSLFPSAEAVEAVSLADAVVCCVDDPEARLQVLRTCARHLVPAVDVGSSIYLDESGAREQERHGHAWLYLPGHACWLHMGLREQGLESRSLREVRRAMGYVVGDRRESPGSVQTLNAVVVSYGLTLLEAWLMGRRPGHNVVVYEERVAPQLATKVRELRVKDEPECPLCGMDGVVGWGGNPFPELADQDLAIDPPVADGESEPMAVATDSCFRPH